MNLPERRRDLLRALPAWVVPLAGLVAILGAALLLVDAAGEVLDAVLEQDGICWCATWRLVPDG